MVRLVTLGVLEDLARHVTRPRVPCEDLKHREERRGKAAKVFDRTASKEVGAEGREDGGDDEEDEEGVADGVRRLGHRHDDTVDVLDRALQYVEI